LRIRLAEGERIDLRGRAHHDRQPVARCLLHEIVERRHAHGAGYVAHHHGRFSGQVFAEEIGDQASGGVGAAAGLGADDHGDGLVLEGCVLGDRAWPEGQQDTKADDGAERW
jgi:hypothetical protein